VLVGDDDTAAAAVVAVEADAVVIAAHIHSRPVQQQQQQQQQEVNFPRLPQKQHMDSDSFDFESDAVLRMPFDSAAAGNDVYSYSEVACDSDVLQQAASVQR
jgi:hypothetical protein